MYNIVLKVLLPNLIDNYKYKKINKLIHDNFYEMKCLTTGKMDQIKKITFLFLCV